MDNIATRRALVAEILIRTDPMKIHFEDYGNKDEYDAEAAEILSRLPNCQSADDCLTLVYGVFTRQFDPVAGPRERYIDTAEELWRLRRSIEL